jgi:hypothetical protein
MVGEENFINSAALLASFVCQECDEILHRVEGGVEFIPGAAIGKSFLLLEKSLK